MARSSGDVGRPGPKAVGATARQRSRPAPGRVGAAGAERPCCCWTPASLSASLSAAPLLGLRGNQQRCRQELTAAWLTREFCNAVAVWLGDSAASRSRDGG